MTRRMQRVIAISGLAILGLTAASPVFADVTITQKVTGKGLGASGLSDSTTYIKGARMRTDQKVGGDAVSTIIDINAQKMMVVKKNEADVFDLSQINADLAQVTASDVKVELTPTTESKPILGHATTKHMLTITINFSPMKDQNMQIVMGGPVWIAKDAPGKADYATFYKTAAEKGFIFTDPRVAKAQPGHAKGFAAMYKAMAEAGVPLATEIQVRFEGGGMMAAMMNKMGGMTMGTEVTSVSTDPIGDDTFTLPAGIKVKTK